MSHARELIRLDAVSKRFRNGTLALENADLSLAEGEVLALLGPSGCGKSTLLRLIAGLETPTAGTIAWRETPAPGTIGFVFQDATLMPWASAEANAMLPMQLRGLPQARERARAALAALGLAGFEQARPAELSGGMRMRVSLARALAPEPALVLLDEPFAALDEFTRETLQEDFAGLAASRRMSCILVTHSIREAARLAGRVALMTPRPGRIARVMDRGADFEAALRAALRALAPGKPL